MTTILAARPDRILLFGAQAFGLGLIIAAAAHIAVPFWPVPMTLQTLAVMTIATLVGPRLGVAAMLAYLLEGAVGLPVFASGVGMAVLVGPTAGYLLGMVVAAALVGSAHGRVRQAGAIVAASLTIYALGAAWLAQFVGIDRAFALGVLPFVAGDAVKAALVFAFARVLARG
jgi:biotin transport system substrate-specific component